MREVGTMASKILILSKFTQTKQTKEQAHTRQTRRKRTLSIKLRRKMYYWSIGGTTPLERTIEKTLLWCLNRLKVHRTSLLAPP